MSWDGGLAVGAAHPGAASVAKRTRHSVAPLPASPSVHHRLFLPRCRAVWCPRRRTGMPGAPAAPADRFRLLDLAQGGSRLPDGEEKLWIRAAPSAVRRPANRPGNPPLTSQCKATASIPITTSRAAAGARSGHRPDAVPGRGRRRRLRRRVRPRRAPPRSPAPPTAPLSRRASIKIALLPARSDFRRRAVDRVRAHGSRRRGLALADDTCCLTR